MTWSMTLVVPQLASGGQQSSASTRESQHVPALRTLEGVLLLRICGHRVDKLMEPRTMER